MLCYVSKNTHVVLLLTLTLNLTFDFQPQNHNTCRISQYQVLTLLDHSFFSYSANNSLKNALIDPVTLILDLSLSIMEFLSYAPDKQLDRQMDNTLALYPWS